MRMLVAIFGLPLCLLLFAGFAACGGDDAPQDGDVESYFTALEALLAREDTEEQAIGDSLDRQYTSEAEYATAYQTAFHETGAKAQASLRELTDLDPPDVAQDAHQAFVDSLRTSLGVLSDLTAEVDAATTKAGVDAAIGQHSPRITAATSATDAACLELQEIADTNSIDADLRCGTQD